MEYYFLLNEAGEIAILNNKKFHVQAKETGCLSINITKEPKLHREKIKLMIKKLIMSTCCC